MLCPSSPLLLPRPSGQILVAEFINTHALFNAEAFKKIIFELNTYVLLVSPSSTSTPVAFLVFASYNILVTMLHGRTVKLPVATAAGNVDDCVLKYPPNGQPSQQRFLNWHCVLPGIACVRFATR